MHLKRFRKGTRVSFVSQRSGDEMLTLERDVVTREVKRQGITPVDDIKLELDGSTLDIRGLLYDSVGKAVNLGARGEEVFADTMMEVAFPGQKPVRTLIATEPTAR